MKNNKRLSQKQKTELRKEQRAIRQELDKRYAETEAAWMEAYWAKKDAEAKEARHSAKLTVQRPADYAAAEREVPSFAPRGDRPPTQYAAEGQQTGDPPAEAKHSEVFPWNGWESYELTDEFREAVPDGLRHEFLRALANKTSTVKQGEVRHVLIHVGGHAFHFVADGYMHGHMDGDYVVNTGSKQNLRKDRKEFLHGTDENTEGAGIWADEVSAFGGRPGGDISDSGRGRSENKGNDKVSGAERESNRTGYSERDVENNEDVSEFGPGTMYYDGENGYIVNEDGSHTKFSARLTPQRPADAEPGDTDEVGRLISRPPTLYDLAYAMYSGDADRIYRQLSTRQAAPGGWPEPEPEPIPAPAPEPGVDYLSILDLGYGPLSAAQLRDLIEMGKVERVIEDGRVHFRRASRTPGT